MVRKSANGDEEPTQQEAPKLELVTESQLINFKLDQITDLLIQLSQKLDKE
jgi:hypothetical protein